MKLIWLGYFFEIGILTLLNPFILNFDSVAMLAVILHICFTAIVLLSLNKEKFVLLGAFIIRVFFLVWDLFGRNIFVLPNSGSDSEMFFSNAILISENLSLLGGTKGRFYSDINGLLFHFIGPQRIFGQYMNVLLGISTIFVIYKILNLLHVSERVKKTILYIAAFFPNSVIISAIFIREAIPTFFVSLSLYYFIKWFKKHNKRDIIISFTVLGIASMFHSGVIGIALGYAFAILFYEREGNQYKFSVKTISSFILLIIVFSLAFTFFDSIIFGKFRNVEGIEDIYQTATPSGAGGSAYLEGLQITNPLQLAIFGPIKSFYFLSSPLPMDWRGLMDIFTFFTDALFYLGTILYFIRNRKKLGDRKLLAISIIVMIVGATIIFGIGVNNAGTAIRHRQKLIPLFLILFGVMSDGKKRFVEEKQLLQGRMSYE